MYVFTPIGHPTLSPCLVRHYEQVLVGEVRGVPRCTWGRKEQNKLYSNRENKDGYAIDKFNLIHTRVRRSVIKCRLLHAVPKHLLLHPLNVGTLLHV